MSASDDESELDGEEAMFQCNLTDADQDDNEEVPEAKKGKRNSEEEEEAEEEEEEGDPTRTDANALVPIGGPVDGGDEEDPQSLVGRRIMKYFPNPGAWFGGEVIAVHPPDPPDQRGTLYTVTFEDDDLADLTLAELLAILRPLDVHPRQLLGSTDWGLFKKQCATIGSALNDGSFSGAARPFLAKVFRFQRPETMTAKKMKQRLKAW